MKPIWIAIVAVEIGVLAAYSVWAGPLLNASSVGWLALVFAAFDLSIAVFLNGVRAFRTSKTTTPWVSFLAGIAVFVFACWLLTIFVTFGIPQS